MKRILLLFASVAAIAASSPATDSATPQLRAGASAVDVTPKMFPLNVPGLFTPRLADSAHDPLHARALVLDDGTTTVALVVVDNLQVAEEVCDEAKASAAQQCGIGVERILIASTHTHSGPSSNVKSGPAPEVAYRQLLVAGIAQSIVRAQAALRPAAVGVAGRAMPDEVYNRRWFLKPGKMPPNPFGEIDQVKMNPIRSPTVLDRPAGPTDPDLTILSVEDTTSQQPLALLANYALHYVGGVPDGVISADYFGEFARVMQSRAGDDDDFVAMMSNGAEGDVINRPFLVSPPPRQPFEQIQIVAAKAADTAWRARATITAHRPDTRLGMLQRPLTLKLRRPTDEQVARAKAVLAMTDQADRDQLPPLADVYARRVLSLAAAPQTMTVPLQALAVGDLAMCAIPFEAFVEIGLELKQRSPFRHTMVIGLANGNNGYLPTPAQHKLGGYETWLGSNRVQEDASVILTSKLLAMLNELHQAAAEPSDSARWPKSDHFESTILAFEAADQTHPPAKQAILFTGASNIVGWKTLTRDFAGLEVINRGFGGAHIADCVYYAERIVVPYEPRMIVFRAGGNDIEAGKTPAQVAADFKAFVEKVHARLPHTRIAYWPMTPSIARLANWDREDQGNRLIQEYIAANENLIYIDAATATLGQDGEPRPELFRADGLHFSAQAYKMFTVIIRPYLE